MAGIDLFSQADAEGERANTRFEFDLGTDDPLTEIGAVDVDSRFPNRIEITNG